jgi:hypothetical protein
LFDISTSFASGEEAVRAIFDGKKGKRVDGAPAKGSKSKDPQQKHKRGKKGKKRAGRRATTTATKTLLSTQLDGALDRPLEALGFSMTC